MVEAFKQALDRQDNGYSPSYGIPDLREAIAVDERSKGWACQAQDVYVTHGVTEALQILFAAFLHRGDSILAPGPHYPPYLAYPQMYGAKTVEYALDSENGWAIDVEDIRSKMNENVRFIVLINPNNPTGNVATASEILKVLDIAREWPNCTVIADEIYDGLDFSGSQRSIASLSDDSPVILSLIHISEPTRPY